MFKHIQNYLCFQCINRGGCSSEAINIILESNLTSKSVDDLIAPNDNSEGEGNNSPGLHLLTEDIPEPNQLNGADDKNTSNLTRKEKVLLINAFVLK
ncbi:unnamed protein product, partial [Allacma fusca]